MKLIEIMLINKTVEEKKEIFSSLIGKEVILKDNQHHWKHVKILKTTDKETCNVELEFSKSKIDVWYNDIKAMMTLDYSSKHNYFK